MKAIKSTLSYSESTLHDAQHLQLRIVPRSRPCVARLPHRSNPSPIAADTVTHKLNAVYDNQASTLEQPFLSAQLGALSHEAW